jgi:hypothetical protein
MSDITDDTGIQNDVIHHSNSPSDVTSDSTKASRKLEIEKGDKTEPPAYMELKPRQESNTIYQSLQDLDPAQYYEVVDKGLYKNVSIGDTDV